MPTLILRLLSPSWALQPKSEKHQSTPDNADKMLTSIDFVKFHSVVSENEMSEAEMFALLKECVVDPNVGDLHLVGLSCYLMFLS
jgi:hypothetical protein